MRSRIVVVFTGILVLMAVVASLSIGAAVKQYQATGAVTDVDAKGKTLSVDKGGEIWQFSTEGLKDMKAKKGDKVTVYYQMIAKKVEMK
jgi:predicted lipoprotein with Yx(FWY)xxD motif